MITFCSLLLIINYSILFGDYKGVDWDELPMYLMFALLEFISLDLFIIWIVLE